MADNPELTINHRILDYARHRLGRQVGTGECWDFPEEVVTKSGGLSSKDLTKVPDKDFGNADYVWGTQIELSDVKPGDILQFSDHEFKATWPDGHYMVQTRGHHTAIVDDTSKMVNGRLTILEQHVTVKPETRKTLTIVKRHEIFFEPGVKTDVDALKIRVETTGTIKAYRATAKQSSPPANRR